MSARPALCALALLTVAVAGCGHHATPAAVTSTAAATTSTPATSAVVTPSTSSPSSVSSAPVITPTTSAVPPGPCTSAQLAVTAVHRTTGSTGRQTAELVFRNTASTACTLRGAPAVDLVDGYGMQAGPSAATLPGATTTVTLAGPATASAPLTYVTGSGTSCQPDTVATLLVFAPGSTRSTAVPFTASVCTAAADRPGVGPVAAGA